MSKRRYRFTDRFAHDSFADAELRIPRAHRSQLGLIAQKIGVSHAKRLFPISPNSADRNAAIAWLRHAEHTVSGEEPPQVNFHSIVVENHSHRAPAAEKHGTRTLYLSAYDVARLTRIVR